MLTRAPRRLIAGVLPRERLAAFETMLWRVSRGIVFLRQADLDDLVKDPKTVSKHLARQAAFSRGNTEDEGVLHTGAWEKRAWVDREPGKHRRLFTAACRKL